MPGLKVILDVSSCTMFGVQSCTCRADAQAAAASAAAVSVFALAAAAPAAQAATEMMQLAEVSEAGCWTDAATSWRPGMHVLSEGMVQHHGR